MRDYFSNENEEKDIKKEERKFLVFTIDNEKFAFDINNVTEIIDIKPLRQVPDLPVHIKGILNVRDKIYPVSDLRIRFRKEEKEYTEKTCIILLEYKGLHVGVIIDDILEITTCQDESIKESPKEKSGFYNRFISNMIDTGDGDLILILDCDALFVNEEEYIKEINSSD